MNSLPFKIFLGFLLVAHQNANAQKNDSAPDPGEVIREVYEVLAGKRPAPTENLEANLKKGAWEALSYLEEQSKMEIEDLREAVPDYYRFFENEVLLKLINPENYNEYGTQVRVTYRVSAKNQILLLDKEGKVKEEWKVIYLDKNYLALDMGGLRVFFTHTRIQE